MMDRNSLSLLVLVVGVWCAPADEVDRYVRAYMDDQHIPGVSLAVLRQGKSLKSQGYGYADLERKIRVTRDTVFQVQSVTKTFTATAVMMLVEEGKLSLDEKIGKYLKPLPESWERITIRHLLTHTSGIKDFINEPTVELTKDIQPRDVIRSLEKLRLNFEPGQRYAYSNTGFHLLGMIIEKITGDTWQNFLRSKIFKPLNMNNTDLNSAQCDLRNRALGYSWRSNKFEPGRFVAPTILGYAGGGILSTVVDLAKWDNALFRDKVVSRSSMEDMWTPARLNNGQKTGYGLGWGCDDYLGFPTVGHGGAHMTGFKSYFARFLKQELTVIVLCNARQAEPANMAMGIAGFYLPELQLANLKEREDPSPTRHAALTDALAALAAQKECPQVTPEFFSAYVESDNRAQSLARRLQDMKSFKFLDSRDISGNHIERYGVPIKDLCIYRLTTPTESRNYTFYLASDGRLAAYQSLTQ